MAIGRDQADFIDPNTCSKIIHNLEPRAVINAAAYTAVDEAENEEIANIINSDTPAAIAKACAEIQIPFVHISTDYVFGGSNQTAWKPDDPTKPRNAYGRSKLAGEKGILASGATFSILRTSWVFSAHGRNFVKNILKLSKKSNTLRVVADQIGGPTPATDIAQACFSIARQLQKDPSKTGILSL